MQVKNASFAYKNGEAVFEHVDLNLLKGEVLTILGANGVGKTTFIKCLAGLLKFTSGSVEMEQDTRLSYVPQTKEIPLPYNVLDFVSFGRNGLNSYLSSPSQKDYQIAESVLKRLGIYYLFEKKMDQLSGGERQMCYIAKSLVSDPDILILDEVESNLDFKNQRKIMLLLQELAEQGKTIILNTHYLNHAYKLSDKCLLMSKNDYKFGEKNDVLTIENLVSYFDVPIKKIESSDGESYFVIA